MNFALSNWSIGQSSILKMQIDHQKALNHQFYKAFIDSFKYIAGFFLYEISIEILFNICYEYWISLDKVTYEREWKLSLILYHFN